MELIGSRVILRPIEKSDTDLIVAWRNDPLVRRNYIFQQPFTREMHLKWMDEVVATGKAAQFVIVERASNTPIGSTYIRDIDPTHKKGDFGVYIGEGAFRGKGLAGEVTQLMLDFSFTQLDLNKVTLKVLADNIAAIKNDERAGFVREGCLRKDAFVNGQFSDVVLMSMLKSEYKK